MVGVGTGPAATRGSEVTLGPWRPVAALVSLAIAHAAENVCGAQDGMLFDTTQTVLAWTGAALAAALATVSAVVVTNDRRFRPLQGNETTTLGVVIGATWAFHLGASVGWLTTGSSAAAGARLAVLALLAVAAGWGTRRALWRSHDVFLCYSHHNSEEVERLKALLTARGVTAWVDQTPGAVRAGLPWWSAIQEAIPQVRCVLVIIGDRGLGAVQPYEIGFAFAELRPRGGRVIAVRLPGAAEPPPVFEGTSWVQANDLDALADKLAGDLGVRGP